MNHQLAGILTEKHKEIKRLKKNGLPINRGKDHLPIRDFKGAISVPGRIGLIAEIKFASPSAGILCKKTAPISIGQKYEKAGAAAISFLTDKRFFRGELEQLPRLRKAVSLPILRKDFIMDAVQVKESFLYGADAVLLIARILSRQQLRELLSICREFGIAPLTEVHNSHELEKAIDCGAEIIGINNRDLNTFEVNLNTTIELAPQVPDKHIIVSESGITDEKDIQLLKRTRTQAVLVGSSIMRSDHLMKKTRQLVNAGNAVRQDGEKRW